LIQKGLGKMSGKEASKPGGREEQQGLGMGWKAAGKKGIEHVRLGGKNDPPRSGEALKGKGTSGVKIPAERTLQMLPDVFKMLQENGGGKEVRKGEIRKGRRGAKERKLAFGERTISSVNARKPPPKGLEEKKGEQHRQSTASKSRSGGIKERYGGRVGEKSAGKRISQMAPTGFSISRFLARRDGT